MRRLPHALNRAAKFFLPPTIGMLIGVGGSTLLGPVKCLIAVAAAFAVVAVVISSVAAVSVYRDSRNPSAAAKSGSEAELHH